MASFLWEFPTYSTALVAGPSSLSVELGPFAFSGTVSVSDLSVEFPAFSLQDMQISHGSLVAEFSPFVASLTGTAVVTRSLAVGFSSFNAAFAGSQATSLSVVIEPFTFSAVAALVPEMHLALEFPVFHLAGWAASAQASADYAVWVAHIDAETHTTYTEWQVNSVARFNGAVIAALPDGIYELVGDKDAAADIAASVMWAPSALGSQYQKRIDSIYTALRRSSTYKVVVVADEVVELKYVKGAPGTRTGAGKDRTKVGKGLTGTFWQLGYENVDGADFTLVDMEVVTVPGSRRTNGR